MVAQLPQMCQLDSFHFLLQGCDRTPRENGCRKAVKKLDNAPHVGIDGKLKDLLKVTPGARLQYAVVEGTVKPVDEPLTSQFHKDISGVLQKFTIKEHRLVWSSISRT
ncbi:hypothetical protein AMECASPLE_014635, partial [Ameca splendens]